MISEEKAKEMYEEVLRQYAKLLVYNNPLYDAAFWKIWALGDVLEYHTNKINSDISKAIADTKKRLSSR